MSLSKFSMLAFASLLAVQSVARADADRPLTNTKFDPNAKQVELFTAMEDDSISVKLIAKDSTGGNLFISNKTSEPLTVTMPQGFVAVPANAQFGGGMGGGGAGQGMAGAGGGAGGGQQQAMGGGAGGGMGGMGGGGMGGGGMGGGGGGFFSIPPEKTLRVPYTSVCLNHGLAEPTPRSTYRLVRVEEYTENPALQQLINMVGTGRLNQHSAQAATWNIANGISWEELAAKSDSPVPVPGSNYFSVEQLMAAQQIAASAQSIAAEKAQAQGEDKKPATNIPVRTRTSR
ncbi:hypothetical protein [Planctomicrobium piriforme]|uniref:Uncharacterized protein n=1 Tax=Planctomicrobium piriforme TaxID=1576369 RepID=A0A1I3PVB8_9PLAN|nr:hypothetical protein [Planctomicrobium piriforme]SFJ24886.1 hypothetical protein SAMN05421753_11736 [Planctomicrobium piriforme]